MDIKHNNCLFCGNELTQVFVDLGLMPLSNEYLRSFSTQIKGQYFYPLKTYVCEKCMLVQSNVIVKPETIFSDYKYFSSFSTSWLKHCKDYVDLIMDERGLGSQSQVVEIACNDGYLLQYFKEYNVPNYGVEPSDTVANTAREKGIEVVVDFFSEELAYKLVEQRGKADLIICNNVLAHTPYLNSFVKGLKTLLKSDGVITIEFPHILNLMKDNQFDTIYHEHFSYFSIIALTKILSVHGLRIVKIQELCTHGGSLRTYVTHTENSAVMDDSVKTVMNKEIIAGLDKIETYTAFNSAVEKTKLESLKLLVELKNDGKRIAGFGAAAKGNIFLNYCGIGNNFIDYIVDSNPNKQGLLTPGNLIPIVDISYLEDNPPDYLVILPWNLKEEIKTQVKKMMPGWDGKFITFIPKCEIFQ